MPLCNISNQTNNGVVQPCADNEDKKPKAKEVETTLKSIWDDDHVTKLDGGWRCEWCKNTFRGLNANRALTHVFQAEIIKDGKKHGIGWCKQRIPDASKAKYKALAEVQRGKVREKRRKEDRNYELQQHFMSQNADMAKTVFHGSKKQKVSSETTMPVHDGHMSDITDDEKDVKIKCFFCPKDNELDVAIANFINCEGMPFSLVDNPRFHTVIKAAASQSRDYKVPCSKTISTKFLT